VNSRRALGEVSSPIAIPSLRFSSVILRPSSAPMDVLSRGRWARTGPRLRCGCGQAVAEQEGGQDAHLQSSGRRRPRAAGSGSLRTTRDLRQMARGIRLMMGQEWAASANEIAVPVLRPGSGRAIKWRARCAPPVVRHETTDGGRAAGGCGRRAVSAKGARHPVAAVQQDAAQHALPSVSGARQPIAARSSQ